MIKETVERLNDVSEEMFDLIDCVVPVEFCSTEGFASCAADLGMPEKAAAFINKLAAEHFERMRRRLQMVAIVPASAAMNLKIISVICS